MSFDVPPVPELSGVVLELHENNVVKMNAKNKIFFINIFKNI